MPDESVDVIISDGVINLSGQGTGLPGSLRPGGRLAIADIVAARRARLAASITTCTRPAAPQRSTPPRVPW